MNEEQKNESGYTYQQWLEELDALCFAAIGFSYRDLPDIDTYTAWYNDEDISDILSDILYENGLDPSLFL